MKKLQLLLVALALVSFTAFYSCGNAKEKATEAVEEVQEEAAAEEVEEVADTAEAMVQEEVEEMKTEEETPEEE